MLRWLRLNLAAYLCTKYGFREEGQRMLIGGGRGAVPRLIRMLKRRDPNVVYHVAIALGKIGDERALVPLLSVASDAVDSGSRAMASEAVTAIAINSRSSAAAQAVAKTLMQTADGSSARARGVAAEALLKMGWPPSTEEELAKWRVATRRWSDTRNCGASAVLPLCAAAGAGFSLRDLLLYYEAMSALIDIVEQTAASMTDQQLTATLNLLNIERTDRWTGVVDIEGPGFGDRYEMECRRRLVDDSQGRELETLVRREIRRREGLLHVGQPRPLVPPA